MEKINKTELTALLTAISVSSGVLISAGQPVMAQAKNNGMSIAEKGTNLADAEKKDEGKKEEGKKEGTAKKKGKTRGGCNYPCGCHYGVNSKKHGKGGGAKAPEKKTEEKPAEGAK